MRAGLRALAAPAGRGVAILVAVVVAVGAGLGSSPAAARRPVPPPGAALGAVAGTTVRAAAAAVRVVGLGCGGFAVGSGVVVPGGRVLTNRHVVAGADYVEVRRADGVRVGARVERVGRDVDLAVLWAGPAVGPGVAPAGRLEPRRPVTVLGHPGGGPLVRAEGHVAARAVFARPDSGGEGAWVEAPVAAGNSGGPVFAPGGGLVGVVFALERNTGLAGVVDGDTAARFLAGDLPGSAVAICEDAAGG